MPSGDSRMPIGDIAKTTERAKLWEQDNCTRRPPPRWTFAPWFEHNYNTSDQNANPKVTYLFHRLSPGSSESFLHQSAAVLVQMSAFSHLRIHHWLSASNLIHWLFHVHCCANCQAGPNPLWCPVRERIVLLNRFFLVNRSNQYKLEILRMCDKTVSKPCSKPNFFSAECIVWAQANRGPNSVKCKFI